MDQQPRPMPPRPPRRPLTRGGKVMLGIAAGAALLLMAVCTVAVASSPDSQQGMKAGARAAAATPTPGVLSTRPETHQAATPKPSTSPTAPAKLTAEQKAKVQSILQGAIDRYAKAFADGQTALGTTQYADGFAGLAAFNDPNSAASRFRDWRAGSKVEQDAKTYLDAFSQADAFYNADNEPTTALVAWENDIGDLQAAISKWVEVAVSWQIRTKSDADLQAAAGAVNAKLALVRSDLAAVLAAS